MVQKTPEQMKEARQSMGFTSGQMAAATGLANGSMIRKFEQGNPKPGGATCMLIDILTGDLDLENPEHDAAYEEALASLGGPVRLLIKIITGDVDREAHLAAIKATRGPRAGQ